jgi:hypothetical protein
MNPYVNEEMMWQRLKDIQLEVENSRLWATHGVPATLQLVRGLGGRAWWRGLATRLLPRWRRLQIVDDCDSAAEIA